MMELFAEHRDTIFSYFVGVVILAPLFAAAMIAMAHSIEQRRQRRRQRRMEKHIERVRVAMH